jgi:hypothetical protein
LSARLSGLIEGRLHIPSMLLTLLKSKIHHATVTGASLD